MLNLQAYKNREACFYNNLPVGTKIKTPDKICPVLRCFSEKSDIAGFEGKWRLTDNHGTKPCPGNKQHCCKYDVEWFYYKLS